MPCFQETYLCKLLYIQPMDPSIINYLEELCDFRREVHLSFTSEAGTPVSLHTKILRVEPEGEEPFLKTDEGITIPLRRLQRVNGRPMRPLA
ncbi:hypothetical protein SAMN05444008_1161 [Cnuella takakiae]|uniref:Uncharacterized protein n=2 Tax=Cnuella takakiae TaxID=1302690 RepID=A0A1M5GAZ0_9BACT|nr:hypothetical protein SAMN05444008_1161 [Cnuella takakiae]